MAWLLDEVRSIASGSGQIKKKAIISELGKLRFGDSIIMAITVKARGRGATVGSLRSSAGARRVIGAGSGTAVGENHPAGSTLLVFTSPS
jgi:hypothetical protein